MASVKSLAASVAVCLIFVSVVLQEASGIRYHRCFNCRSRGALGDCKDPFYLTANSTIVKQHGGTQLVQPCSSGWCKKFVVDPEYSGREGDKNYIVDRGCLGGGPDDGKDRCFEVTSYHGSPPGYLCVCKGDLCNGARTSTPEASWTVGLCLASALAALGMLSH